MTDADEDGMPSFSINARALNLTDDTLLGALLRAAGTGAVQPPDALMLAGTVQDGGITDAAPATDPSAVSSAPAKGSGGRKSPGQHIKSKQSTPMSASVATRSSKRNQLNKDTSNSGKL